MAPVPFSVGLIDCSHSPSSALPGVGGEALRGRFFPRLPASVRSDAGFFWAAKNRSTGFLTGRTA
jgi:hypothetical protein